MLNEEDYLYSDHILENTDPVEELALTFFQQAIASGQIKLGKSTKEDFQNCLDAAEVIMESILERRAEASNAVLKVVSMKKK